MEFIPFTQRHVDVYSCCGWRHVRVERGFVPMTESFMMSMSHMRLQNQCFVGEPQNRFIDENCPRCERDAREHKRQLAESRRKVDAWCRAVNQHRRYGIPEGTFHGEDWSPERDANPNLLPSSYLRNIESTPGIPVATTLNEAVPAPLRVNEVQPLAQRINEAGAPVNGGVQEDGKYITFGSFPRQEFPIRSQSVVQMPANAPAGVNLTKILDNVPAAVNPTRVPVKEPVPVNSSRAPATNHKTLIFKTSKDVEPPDDNTVEKIAPHFRQSGVTYSDVVKGKRFKATVEKQPGLIMPPKPRLQYVQPVKFQTSARAIASSSRDKTLLSSEAQVVGPAIEKTAKKLDEYNQRSVSRMIEKAEMKVKNRVARSNAILQPLKVGNLPPLPPIDLGSSLCESVDSPWPFTPEPQGQNPDEPKNA